MSSQELFLGVVLEWQRSATDGAHSHQPYPVATDAYEMQTTRSHNEVRPTQYSDIAGDSQLSASSDDLSDSEPELLDARYGKRRHYASGVSEVSPTRCVRCTG